MEKQIEEYIKENLIGEAQTTALEFVAFLRSNNIEFYKDRGSCWKDKIYYWLKFKNECVAFIAIKDPDEPQNLWTVWSDDSKAFETDIIDDKIKNTAWKHIDFCGHCGSCGGGKRKVIFGKEFSEVCGCTFRIDNPQLNDLPFLKKMVELCKLHISNNSVIEHYDLLIGENNDPVHDPKPLRDYMDKWDGQDFIYKMELDKDKSVLEIGVGTGRLAVRVAPLCGQFYGIDISTKTIDRAKENLSEQTNVKLLCGDFQTLDISYSFDVIYSSLTFMHIEEKQTAINKVVALLKDSGKFVLSIDKNRDGFIDTGTRKITVFPDTPAEIKSYISNSGLLLIEHYETEFAHIFVAKKECKCYCGHDCSRCVTYIATQTDDDSLREQSQSFYKEQFRIDIPLGKFKCCGGRTDNVFELCQDCPFRKCCLERNISSCNLCPEYPCTKLRDYQMKYVNKCNQI